MVEVGGWEEVKETKLSVSKVRQVSHSSQSAASSSPNPPPSFLPNRITVKKNNLNKWVKIQSVEMQSPIQI